MAEKKNVEVQHEDKRRTGAINDKVVVFVFADFLLEPVHILREVSTRPSKILGLARSERAKGAPTYSKQ
jgi:hypothetical protein